MSAFDEPNADAYSIGIDEGSRGPRLGFQASFEASLDVQRKVNAQFGLERSFRDVEYAQIKKMRDAGLEPHRSLDADLISPVNVAGADLLRMSPYSQAAKAIVDGDEHGAHDEAMQMRDEQIQRLQKEHPDLGLKTYAEMFKDVTDQAQEAIRRNSLPTTTMGAVGGFLGGAAGAMDPLRNPINFGAGLIGGGGSIPARMAIQGGVQAGVEGLDILTNDNERLLTGHEATAGENAKKVLYAAGGGMVFQGLLEGGAAGVRRATIGKWFSDLPIDKLPTREVPPTVAPDLLPGERMPPGRPINDYPDFNTFAQAHGVNVEFERSMGGTREATARKASDLDYATTQLNRWDGPAPHEIAARTETAPPPDVEPGVRYDGAYQRYVDRLETVDDVARRLDPDLFAKYDKLATQREELRAAIDRGRELGDLRPNADRPDMKAQFEAQRAAAEQSTREQIMRVDAQMRDLPPLVSRVYGAADKEWRSTPVDSNTLSFLKNLENRTGWRYRGEDKASLTEQPLREKAPPPVSPPQTIGDAMPLSRLSSEQTEKLRPGSDVADRVAIAAHDAIEAIDAKVEHFVKAARALSDKEAVAAERASLRKQIAEGAGLTPEALAARKQALEDLDYVKMPDGSKLHLDNDKLPGPDGKEVSVRDFLREMDKDQHALDAVVTCSRPS